MDLTIKAQRFAKTARFFITGLPKYAVGWYPGYINMMDSTLELVKSQNAKRVTDNCEFRLKAFALGPTGEPKGECMMGDNADRDRCGCVVPFHMATLSSRRLMIKEQFKFWQSQRAPAS